MNIGFPHQLLMYVVFVNWDRRKFFKSRI